jgi:hypothetical protein
MPIFDILLTDAYYHDVNELMIIYLITYLNSDSQR